MSKVTNRTLRCRKCQKEFDVQIYESVNVSLNPELREKFIFDELYVFKCPHCGEIHYIPYPILYNDMDKGFMVQAGSLEDAKNRFKPAMLVIRTNGDYGMLFDDSNDFENGTVVCIKPDFVVTTSDEYL